MVIVGNMSKIVGLNEIRAVVKALAASTEKVTIRWGKGYRKRVVAGTVENVYPKIFTVEHAMDGEAITESFMYTELLVNGFSVIVDRSGLELLPKEDVA